MSSELQVELQMLNFLSHVVLNCFTLFFVAQIDGVKNDTNSQLASDMRRSKGEANRLGGLPSTPFDLLVLDPYGAGLEGMVSC